MGDMSANIVEVSHQRAFTNLPLQSAEVRFVLQTRGHIHLKQIVDALSEAGYQAHLPDRDARNCLA
jgi:threonine dehydratase